MEAHPDIELDSIGRAVVAHRFDHVERHVGHILNSAARRLDPTGDHVGVTDRLDLLEAVPVREQVEDRKDLVQDAQHLGRQSLR